MLKQKKVKSGEQITKADVVEEIKNLEGITYDDLGNTIEGEFQEYIYTIDKDFNVIVGQKVSGDDIEGVANILNKGDFAEEVEIQVVGNLKEIGIASIESLSDGVTLSQDRSSSEKVYKVKDNGTYVFRITGNNGRRIKVSCLVTNAIPIKKDLLTAIADINTSGVSKCKVIGKPGENLADEPEIYSLDTILYEGDLILDGYSDNIEGAILSAGKIYSFGNIKDVSDGTNYAEHAVVLKINGNLTVKDGVTLTSVSGSRGGPLGLYIYCSGTIRNDGIISMSGKGAYSKGQNVYLYKNNNETYEVVPKMGGKGGKGQVVYAVNSYLPPIKGEDGIERSTGGGSGGSAFKGTNTDGLRFCTRWKWKCGNQLLWRRSWLCGLLRQ